MSNLKADPWLARLFPAPVTNHFPGRKIAFLAYWPVTALIVWRSAVHVMRGDGGAQSIASMPLDSYPAGARTNIVALFAQWGLSQLLIALILVLVGVRYRALVPLMWLVLAIEAGGRQLVGLAKPIATIHTAPGAAANLPMLALALVMLILSLAPPRW